MVQKVLNFITLGKFDQAKKDLNYDTMFHLFTFINLEGAGTYRMEKNEVVRVTKASPPADGDCMIVGLKKELVLGDMFANAIDLQGVSTFWKYNAISNNCQVFINTLLKANGLLTDSLNKFIMQDVVTLFTKLPSITEKIASLATDTAARLDILRSGKGLNKKSTVKIYE